MYKNMRQRMYKKEHHSDQSHKTATAWSYFQEHFLRTTSNRIRMKTKQVNFTSNRRTCTLLSLWSKIPYPLFLPLSLSYYSPFSHFFVSFPESSLHGGLRAVSSFSRIRGNSPTAYDFGARSERKLMKFKS